MAKRKKIVKQTEVNPEPIVQIPQSQADIDANSVPLTDEEKANFKPISDEPAAVTKIVLEDTPVYIPDPQIKLYRELLLERPAVPVITNMQEAIAFAGLYEKWNSKAKLLLK